MLDFSRVTGFEWDEGNSRKSVDKHGVSQSEAEQIFLDPRLLVLVDDRHSGAEKRFAAYGRSRRAPVACQLHASVRGHIDPRDLGAHDEPQGEGSL